MSQLQTESLVVGGPYFEDLEVGQVFTAPSLTLTSGHAAAHQALTGDRLRLALDAELCRAVTGAEHQLAHPNLVCDVAIGQSTEPSQRVLGNLFYRGLVMLAPVFLGDTLSTRTEIVALRQNRPRPDRSPTGLAVLRITTVNQRAERVLDFWRCPMLPLRDGACPTGHADSLDAISDQLGAEQLRRAVPAGWRLAEMRRRCEGPHFAQLSEGARWRMEGRDTVTAAVELVRLTLNLAAAHSDARASMAGRRLVYGGHTISVAAAHATRALANLVTILAWKRCDHLAPVFEGDALRTELELEQLEPLPGGGGLAHLRALVFAERGAERRGVADGSAAEGSAAEGRDRDGDEVAVLDWRFVGLMA